MARLHYGGPLPAAAAQRGRMLHIIANSYFLASFVLEGIDPAEDVATVRHERPRRGLPGSVLKTLEAIAGAPPGTSRYFSSRYVERLLAIEPTDRVLFFGIDDLRELSILRRLIRTPHVSVFTWNPVTDYNQSPWLRRRHVRLLKRIGTVYTFDPADAEAYGLRLTDQVFRDVGRLADARARPEVDVYFVGQDKGRLAMLEVIRDQLGAAGLSSYFHVVRDRRRRYSPAEERHLATAPLSYAANVGWVNRSRALLEVLQRNQTGPSVRSLEAAFFGRKLLTTNARIRDSRLYDPARVFILGVDDPRGLASFVRGTPAQWPSEVLRRHDFRHWCRQFG